MRTPSWFLVVLCAVLAACTGGEKSPGGEPIPDQQIARAVGEGQTGPVGAQLASPLAIRVTDAAGRPVPGVITTWIVGSGGGTLSANQTTTDAQGFARTLWTLGSQAGPQHVEASVAGLPSVRFGAIATPGPAAKLQAVPTQILSGTAGTTLRDSLAVQAVDAFGNPVSGVPVTWAVTSGAGTIAPDTVITDSAGIARAQWLLGPAAGQHIAVAAGPGLSPVEFIATAAPGVAAKLEQVSGNRQTGTAGAALGDSLVVRVSSAAGAPIAGANVGWQITGGGGSIAPAIATTDSLGLARAVWTLGTAPGTQTAAAYAAGTTAPFTATAKP